MFDEKHLEVITYNNNYERALDIISKTKESTEYDRAYCIFSNSESYKSRESYIYKDMGIVGLFTMIKSSTMDRIEFLN